MKSWRIPLVMLPLLVSAGAALNAQPEAAPADLREKGRALFKANGCFQCHALADADANGVYAPSLDNNPHLTRAFVTATLTTGRGDMPSFGGLLSEAEIALLADYLVDASKKDGAP